MMAIDVRKQQEPDANPNANQQANFMRNLDQDGNTSMFFIIEEVT